MSQAEERSATPQKAGYRAPGATVVGSVQELTAGNTGDYADNGGAKRGLAFRPDDEPASRDDDAEE